MEHGPIGSQGLNTSRLGLGCMGMSEFYGAFDDSESIKVMHRAIELGITFLDTADMYGPFTNEILVGKAIRGKRNEVTLATKFGVVRDPNDLKSRKINGRPEYVKKACDASLKRLEVDEIDLYYLHRKDPDVPIDETVGAIADLVRAGKVLTIGLSEVAPATLKKAHATHPISALQTEYSLWSRDPEKELLETCRTLGIAFVAYSPLGRGMLSGCIRKFEDLPQDDVRRNWPRFQRENFQKNLDIVLKLEEFAKKKGCTPSQLALAWILAQGDHIIPIPGTKRLRFLEENAESVNITFEQAELSEIDAISPRDGVSGLRYPEPVMKLVDQ